MNRNPPPSTPRGGRWRPSHSTGDPSGRNPNITGPAGAFSDSRRGGRGGGRRNANPQFSPVGFPAGVSGRRNANACWVMKKSNFGSFNSEVYHQDQTRASECLEPSCCSSESESESSTACSTSRNAAVAVTEMPTFKNASHQPWKSGDEDESLQEESSKRSELAGDIQSSENLSIPEPFDICIPYTGTTVVLNRPLFDINREKRNEIKRDREEQRKILRPGMVLLKGYVSLDDQVKIVKQCRNLGIGPGGFYRPGYHDGAKLSLKMMCLGRNWDPDTSTYQDVRSVDGASPPPIPDEFYWWVEKALKDSNSFLESNAKANGVKDTIPAMSPDVCIVNFYTRGGQLGLHQDKDESKESLRKGLPVVSFSIGDTGEFLYSDKRDEKNAERVLLESGDVLIFGGKSRHVFHGVRSVKAQTAPKFLLDKTNLREGRLNLTFRRY